MDTLFLRKIVTSGGLPKQDVWKISAIIPKQRNTVALVSIAEHNRKH